MTTAIEYLIGDLAPSIADNTDKGALREAFASTSADEMPVIQSGARAAAGADPLVKPIVVWELINTRSPEILPARERSSSTAV